MREFFRKRIEEIKEIPEGFKKPRTRAMKPGSDLQAHSERYGVHARVEITPETRQKLSEARQIMGSRLIMPGEVEFALGTSIDQRFVNEFPFTPEQLEQLKKDSIVMYFPEDTQRGEPLTMRKLNSLKQRKTQRLIHSVKKANGESFNGKGKMVSYFERVVDTYRQSHPGNLESGEDFYENETPRPGWRAVTLNTIPETMGEDFLGQIAAISNHIQSMSQNGFKFSEDISRAIHEFDDQKDVLSHLAPFYPEEAAVCMTGLAIAQMTLPRPVELALMSSVLNVNTDRKFLEKDYSSTCSSFDLFVDRKNTKFKIVQYSNEDPFYGKAPFTTGANPDTRHYYRGAVLSLGSDALPTPPQTEEPKAITVEKSNLILLPAPARKPESKLAADLPFDPERDISDADFKQMVDYIKKTGLAGTSLHMAAHMKLFAPQRLLENYGNVLRNTRLNQKNAIKGYKELLKKGYKYLPDLKDIAERTYVMITLFPDSYNKFKPSFLMHHRLENQIQGLVKKGAMLNNLDLFYLMNILYPDSVRQKYGHLIDRKLIEQIYDLGELRKNTEFYLETEAYFKILSPNYEGKVDWERVKRAIKEVGDEGEYEKMAQMAAHATILAAQEVKVTDKGLEITMRKPEPKRYPGFLTDRSSATEPYFDPERDIPEEEYKEMLKELSNLRGVSRDEQKYSGSSTGSQSTIYKYMNTFIALSTLFPNRLKEWDRSLWPTTKHDYWYRKNVIAHDIVYIGLPHFVSDSFFYTAIDKAAQLKRAFPGKETGLESVKHHLDSFIKHNMERGRTFDMIQELGMLNIIFPNWITDKFMKGNITRDARDERMKGVNQDENNILLLMQAEAAFRIITGAKYHFIDMEVVKKAIASARQNKDYQYLAQLYENVLLLTAEEVRVTENGLEVINRKDQKSDDRLLPFRKPFRQPLSM